MRQEFAAWVFRQIDIDENWPSNFLWTDDAHFSLNGEFNFQNSCIWATENPRIFTEMPLHQPIFTVLCGFTSSFVIGPLFFEKINRRTFKPFFQTITIQAWRRKEEDACFIPGEWKPSRPPSPQLPGVKQSNGGQDGGEAIHHQLYTNIKRPRRKTSGQTTSDGSRAAAGSSPWRTSAGRRGSQESQRCGVSRGRPARRKSPFLLGRPAACPRCDPPPSPAPSTSGAPVRPTDLGDPTPRAGNNDVPLP
ncbi:hypothetical protein LAZ67_3001420 [Cordylochernes scorpioides]|uniref:Uncharacterized protein n=1 Tax=Cordylochernes scorpioides TaxID=51811 RepID=A0ABY6K799_9ARAC|nr:hypothetical protein LAZ67_3001420 [Cordylochernes scorpioides]